MICGRPGLKLYVVSVLSCLCDAFPCVEVSLMQVLVYFQFTSV